MSHTLFISDLHLDASRPQLSLALEAFLRRHGDCRALYILGDLFDTWVGDDDDSVLARSTGDLLRRFTAAGPELYIMGGNRDFLLGAGFTGRCGATLLPDPSVIDLYGVPTLLVHGDSLCTDDSDYQSFREVTRQPAWQAQMLGMSLQERRELAAQLRATSREAVSNKAADIMDVNATAVTRAMADHGVAQLIHGHTHRPGRHDLAAGVRWVLGDWGPESIFAIADSKGISLNSHFISKR